MMRSRLYLIFDDESGRFEFYATPSAPPVAENHPPSIRRGRIFFAFDEEPRFEFYAAAIADEPPVEPPTTETPTAGGWTWADLIEYERRRREALEAQEAAERAATELIRQEQEEAAKASHQQAVHPHPHSAPR
mgnify:CR=1 FL=1